MRKQYIALFEFEDGQNGYSVVFPDFPGCVSAGDDFNDAVRMAHEALALHISAMKADGEKIPEPRTLEEIKNTWPDWQEWVNNYKFLVGYVAAIPDHYTRKYTISMDSELMDRIDTVTKNRSAFLAEAARRILDAEF